MKGKTVVLVAALCALVLSAVPALAGTDPVNTVVTGCEKELSTFCKDVTPGGGRVLACLFAYNDKLSNRCEFALYDASVQLDRVLSTLSFMATECRDDLKQYCADVKPGEGRLLDCLDRNMGKVSPRCKTALKDGAAALK